MAWPADEHGCPSERTHAARRDVSRRRCAAGAGIVDGQYRQRRWRPCSHPAALRGTAGQPTSGALVEAWDSTRAEIVQSAAAVPVEDIRHCREVVWGAAEVT
ncbi:hypothetical protein G6F46_014121 [Rhizopus delemar]|nr:hypothetical protein G6F46_014121 [Rhizopus delemar]